ncbi:MAG: DoxX family membrane protein [Leptospiraceae bacterium]|nr:DoxX family membrane protein [Leptospiraceae bacterium]
MNYLSIFLRLVVAGIFFQTLFFKFSGSEESIYIFTTVGIEPWGRYASGVMELVCGILLLVPSTKIFGSVTGIGIISGAILSHLTILGIEVKGDGGLLFYLALAIFVGCLAIFFIHRDEALELYKNNLKKLFP